MLPSLIIFPKLKYFDRIVKFIHIELITKRNWSYSRKTLVESFYNSEYEISLLQFFIVIYENIKAPIGIEIQRNSPMRKLNPLKTNRKSQPPII